LGGFPGRITTNNLLIAGKGVIQMDIQKALFSKILKDSNAIIDEAKKKAEKKAKVLYGLNLYYSGNYDTDIGSEKIYIGMDYSDGEFYGNIEISFDEVLMSEDEYETHLIDLSNKLHQEREIDKQYKSERERENRRKLYLTLKKEFE
jgi:hypothetical protein